MCTKFYYNNLVPEAVYTPSTENALFPVSNLADDRRSKVFRSTSNSTTIYFDFGSAEPIDSFLAVGHVVNGLGFSTASLELNNVATWTSGAIATLSVSLDVDNSIAFGSIVSAVNARYAKLILTSTLGYCEVSKIFIGKMADVVTNDFAYPLKFSQENLASVQKNRGGQKFIDSYGSQKLFSGSIDSMNQTEGEVIYQLVNTCSVDRPFFMRIEDAAIFIDNNRVSGYYYLKSDPVFNYTNGGFLSVDMNLEEGM